MNKFNFKIEITCSMQRPLYDERPDLGVFTDYGYVYSFYIEGTLSDAMDYSEKLCISEFKTKSLIEIDPDCFYFEDEEDVIDPYVIKIKNIIHKNIVVGGKVKSNQVDWIIPDINEDIELMHQKSNQLLGEASEEIRSDSFNSARWLRQASDLVLLRCSDYWKYTPCENMA